MPQFQRIIQLTVIGDSINLITLAAGHRLATPRGVDYNQPAVSNSRVLGQPGPGRVRPPPGKRIYHNLQDMSLTG
jgi:hypothetical protein